MKLYIKNMVCKRCVMVVSDILKENGLNVINVQLGEAEIEDGELSPSELINLDSALTGLGFERISDKGKKLVEKIKNFIIEKIHQSEDLEITTNWSVLISGELKAEYPPLSSLFSSLEGITIEQFIIRQKIERAKELLFYDELNLNEIAYKLGYSSVQHLSGQFKKVTGLTPSAFKNLRGAENLRKPLDDISQ